MPIVIGHDEKVAFGFDDAQTRGMRLDGDETNRVGQQVFE